MSIDIEDYAQRYAQVYDGEIPDLVLEAASRLHTGQCLLDIGCGDGALLDAIAKRFPNTSFKLRGVDLSHDRIAILQRVHPEIEACVDDAEQVRSVESDSVDLLVTSQVIEHVDDQKMMEAMSRLVKKDGFAYVSTVWKKPWALYFHRRDGKFVIDPTHVREYTEDHQLVRLAEQNGFSLVHNRKTPIAYPIIDPLVKKLWRGRAISKTVGRLRKLKVPVPGYYLWELLLQKN